MSENMKRLFTLFLACTLCSLTSFAQLPDGSIAPDFTGTDIDGNTHNLYDLLDAGKTVILDVSATWCGPCWSYHQTHALEDVYENYGPNGTDEMMVLWVEGDAGTNVACIYNTDDCVGGTQGDWTDGTSFPIIDDASIATAYQIGYYPTIYMICPSRTVTEVGQASAADLYAGIGNCPVAVGANNTGVLGYTGFAGSFCTSETFAPAATIQNLGSDVLTSATFEVSVNGSVVETFDWTGSLSTFGTEEVTFSDVTVDGDSEIMINVTSTNGVTDEDDSDNMVTANVSLAPETDQNILTLTVTTDQYNTETYWELLDDNGTAVYVGGNQQVVGGTEFTGIYTEPNTTYTTELAVPTDGCFTLNFYDAYGDGICCEYGDGSYALTDADGNVLASGGQFEFLAEDPVSFNNTAGIENNAQILTYNGETGFFCGETSFSPTLLLQNLGSTNMTSATIEASTVSGVIATYEWTGDVDVLGYATVDMDEITVMEEGLTFTLTQVNGVDDVYDYNNITSVDLEGATTTEENELIFEMQADAYPEEIYWQVTNEAGDVVAFGGNEEVGLNGGTGGLANPDAPGAYQTSNVIDPFTLPAGVSDCYNFTFVDYYGDGIDFQTTGTYIRITDINGNILLDIQTQGVNFAVLDGGNVFADLSSSVEELTSVVGLNVFPNPVSENLTIEFGLEETSLLDVSVYNTLGQKVATIADENFVAGNQMLNFDASALSNGIYYVQLSDGNRRLTRKFTVVGN